MSIPVLSFGSISTVRQIPVGTVFILPMEVETVVAMMVGASSEHERSPRIAILSEPAATTPKRFEILNSALYLSNKVVVVDDVAFLLSAEPNHCTRPKRIHCIGRGRRGKIR
jgi:hypothetical protein